jgi:hypothetical protein
MNVRHPLSLSLFQPIKDVIRTPCHVDEYRRSELDVKSAVNEPKRSRESNE